MRISFDLDDTLICRPPTPSEPPPPFWRRWLAREPLRRGAVGLIAALRTRGCTVWVYTTSFRSPGSVRRWLRAHGVRVDGIVNQEIHDRVVGRSGPSKYPPAFGIDLHVDDLPGVAIEGDRLGFAVVVVRPEDPDWAARILGAADERIEPSRGVVK